MARSISQQTLDICRQYRRSISLGEEKGDIITDLAALYDVQRPAIHKALRAGGVLPPYRAFGETGRGRPLGGGAPGYAKRRREKAVAIRVARRERMDNAERVDRDPCQRCGVRHDIGCKHSRAPLGMML